MNKDTDTDTGIDMDKPKSSRREITDCITKSAISYFVHKRNSVFKELGIKEWGSRRVDVISLALKKRTLTIVEVKSCHNDFKGDKKLEEYLPYCNLMYLAIPKDSTWIDQYKDRLKFLGIGLMELTSGGTIKVIMSAKRRTMKKHLKYSMLTRMCWRCGTYNLRTHSRRIMKTTASGIKYQDLAERHNK